MDISGKFANDWWIRFWWIRGVLAALTVITLVPSFVDLSRFQLLRGFHLIILRWNDFAAWLGGLLGNIPFVPELSPTAVNWLIFCSVFSIPAVYGALRSHHPLLAPYSLFSGQSTFHTLGKCPETPHWKALLFILPKTLYSIGAWAGIALSLFLVVPAFIFIAVPNRNNWPATVTFETIALWFVVIWGGLITVLGIAAIPGFARG